MNNQPDRSSWEGIHSAVWLAPAAALLIAILPLPYGYYTLLRLVVCGATAFIAYQAYGERGHVSGWVVVFGILALLFNPLIPVQLNRELWAPIDIGAAVIMLIHWRRSKTYN